jgi:lysophospholipase L1-like esterase
MNVLIVAATVGGMMSVAMADEAVTREVVEKVRPEVYRRTVFIGDSITDGNTYPALVRTALEDGKRPGMVSICAGIGGDTAAGMRKRLVRDCLSYRPTLVTFNAGANDAIHGVGPEAYEKDVRAVAEALKEAKIPLILLTTNIVGEKNARVRPRLAEFDAILRRIAKDYGLAVAEVNQRQNEALKAGTAQLSEDDLHPNYEGQRSIARAVLDAMGYADLAVPKQARNELLPGVLTQWKARERNKREDISEKTIGDVKVDETWTAVELPDKTAAAQDWLDDVRAQGACTSLQKKMPKGILAVTVVRAEKAKKVFMNVGAEDDKIFLNGKEIYHHTLADWYGWHLAKQAVPIELKEGENTFVMQAGGVFFLSLTDEPIYDVIQKEQDAGEKAE